ncbi:MAG: YkgJ family cysteine cluster protein [Clostridium sp.]
MKREVSLAEISDGKLYSLNDMVKADCHGCDGCSACCHGMGSSIVLDPFDIYRMVKNLEITFEQLLLDPVELNVVDGIILPNIKMTGSTDGCAFLDDIGRCRIHSFRPGICRLFPLGRYYENHSFKYFLQVHECPKKDKTKVKVRRWVDTPDLKHHEAFVLNWHYFLNDLEEIAAHAQNDEMVKNINLYVLNHFYIKPYDVTEDFYPQFEVRLNDATDLLINENPKFDISHKFDKIS